MDDFEPYIPKRKNGGNAPSPNYYIPPPPPHKPVEDQAEEDAFAAFVCGHNDWDDFTRCRRRRERHADGSRFWESFRRVCEVILALQLSEILRTLVSNVIEKLCK